MNPLSAVDSARNFMNIVKEVNFDEIRDRAEQAPRVLVVSRDQSDAEDAAGIVFGSETSHLVEVRSGEQANNVDPQRHDIIVVFDPGRTSLYESVRSRPGEGGRDHIFYLPGTEAAEVDRLRLEVVITDPELAPALGRHFQSFRAPATHAIIDSVAKVNAKFALVSNMPSIVPILGSLIAAGADFIVLTKNQVMMSYKLAAVNGRDLSDQTGIIRELVPVVGAGFVWRTVAREATSFLPLLAGTVPKVAIAFVGTYTVGRAVDYYYRFGTKPPKEQMRLFRDQAARLAASIPLPGRDSEDETQDDIEAALEASVLEAPARDQQQQER
jgi:uncharacterized protein (DUF697 family)